MRVAQRTVATVRDVLVAFGLVGAVVVAAFVYTGGAWPPILVVESGSMMHCDVREPDCMRPPPGVAYGRYGTIDPGDIVLQKKVRSKADVQTWADGGAVLYGKPGDVIVYYPFNNTNTTPIIHRAMAWVDVVTTPQGREYRVEWVADEVLVFNASGIYLPELGFDERAGFTPALGYQPPISGFITKGDNAVTNDRADQAALNPDDRLAELVQPGWIIGEARGEIPWIGLLKLTFAPHVNQAHPVWIRVGNAFAPYDIWTMLGFSIVVVVLAPLSWDVVRAWREQRAIRRDLERDMELKAKAEAGARAGDDVAPFEPEADGPAPFEPVERDVVPFEPVDSQTR